MPRLLAAIGRFSARHRILVVTAWVVILGIFVGVFALGSAESSSTESSASLNQTDATRALDTIEKEFPSTAEPAPDTLQLVFTTTGAGDITDADTSADLSDVLSRAAAIEGVETVSNPLDPAQPYISESLTTAVSTLTFTDLTEAEKHDAYDAVVDLAGDAPSDLQVDVGGELFAQEFEIFGVGEIVGVLIAFLVLFITFGSMRVAGANMLVAISGVAVGAIGVLAYGALSPIEPTTLTLGTMLGLAVGIDYSLFILTRFRTELREGRSVDDAVARSTGTAGTAVVFAGLTVIIALAGLSVVGIGIITEMGFAGAFGVLVAVLMSLTLLPVLMKSLGRRALGRRERTRRTAPAMLDETGAITTAAAGRGFFAAWGSFVVKRPVLSILGGAVILLVTAIPMLSMKTATTVPGGLDPSSTQRAAYDTVLDEFGGVQSPLLVLAQGDGVSDHLSEMEETLGDLDGVQMLLPPTVNAAGDVALITVLPADGPIDDSTKDLVHEIRADSDMFDGVDIEVTGETAIGIDQDEALQQALITYLILIVALSLVLLIIMFRSLLVPLMATIGFLLSVGAAFGASVAVFQWGWLDFAIRAPQGDPMLSLLPIILVGVLFGLAMDYQVFLVSKIKEMHDRGFSPKDAIVDGFRQSGPVLVAAALIMASVFAGFATSEMAVSAGIAFGLLVGVLADALIVRLVLMPAVLSLLGESAWWVPRWMRRILPDLDMEGHSLTEAPATSSDSSAGHREPAGTM